MNVKIFVCVYSNKLKNIYTLDFSNCKMIPNENKAWNFESLTDKFITQNLVDGILSNYCILNEYIVYFSELMAEDEVSFYKEIFGWKV